MLRSLRGLWDKIRPLPAIDAPLVVLKETAEQTEAAFIAGLLRERGIRATIRVSESSMWVPSTATGWAVVIVPREQEQLAQHVLGIT